MPKRPDNLEAAVLAVELLHRIPRGRQVTAAELHRQLRDAGYNRDLRSIQRYLDALSQAFDIERDERSKPYGYRWLGSAKGLAVPNLSVQESLLMLLAQEQLRHLLPTRVMKSMDGFFTQARRNLGDAPQAALERQWPRKVRVVADSLQLLPPKIAPDVFETVSEALYANRWLHLRYRNVQGKRDECEVMPLGLAQQGPRIYLVCRYKGYDNERNLALHRIESARMSTLDFERPKDFDLERYESEGRFGFGHGQRVRLSFRIDSDYATGILEETPLSADQVLKAIDEDTVRVTATVVDSAHLDWWLRGFGDAVSHVRKRRIRSGHDWQWRPGGRALL